MDKGSRLVVLLVGILAVAVPLAMGTPLVYAKADKALNGRRRGRDRGPNWEWCFVEKGENAAPWSVCVHSGGNVRVAKGASGADPPINSLVRLIKTRIGRRGPVPLCFS